MSHWFGSCRFEVGLSVISVIGLIAISLRWAGRHISYWFDSSRFEVGWTPYQLLV